MRTRVCQAISPSPKHRYLEIINFQNRTTEIFEFADRLSSKDILSPSAEISIRLAETEERQLFYNDPFRLLRGSYICSISEMPYKKTTKEADLMTKASDLTLDFVIWVLERFNWVHIPRDILAEDQRKFFE